mmetsp:Transcript_54666/g.122701  ORF Transcript_54666/g.122701 Transcript_54666/m.122701 type:complete len:337 (+) Transcript_54666:74-1084(+)
MSIDEVHSGLRLYRLRHGSDKSQSDTPGASSRQIGGRSNVESLVDRRARHALRFTPTAADLATVPEELRAEVCAKASVEARAVFLQSRLKCEICAFLKIHCICSQLREVREQIVEDLPKGSLQVQLAVWMHIRERYRASNTGKLLELLLPSCQVYLCDVPEDEERFEAALNRAGGRAFVLFPSEDAVPVSEAMQQLGAQASSRNPDEDISPPLAVVVDGTWRQARRLHKRLEKFPHVALTPPARSEFHWRRQSMEGRISTVEAAALLLEDLGEPAASIAGLRFGLQVLNKAMESQTHYQGIRPPKPGELQGSRHKMHRIPKKKPWEWQAEAELAQT